MNAAMLGIAALCSRVKVELNEKTCFFFNLNRVTEGYNPH